MKKILLFISLLFLSVTAHAWIDIVPIEHLKLGGDVKVKWLYEWDDKNSYNYNVEANMGMLYDTGDTWVHAKLKGITSNGRASSVLIDKVYIGGRVYEQNNMSIDVEIGRNRMDAMFDSKLQFDSYYNGIHGIYNFNYQDLIDMTVHGGVHVIDNANHLYGFIAEAVWKFQNNIPITLKYSFTDWSQPMEPIKGKRPVQYKDPEGKHDYSISQLTAKYQLTGLMIYWAYLINHRVDSSSDGFYFGFTVGEIKKARDLQFDVNFQYAKNRVVPLYDFCGMTKGIQMKIIGAITESFALQGKLFIPDDIDNKRVELSAIYSW